MFDNPKPDEALVFEGWTMTVADFNKLLKLSRERFGDTKKEHLLELLQEGAV